jgi:stearoyl-CoA desaturase (delta-9 desaturase)
MFTFAHVCIPFALYEFWKVGLLRGISGFLLCLLYETIGGLGITAGAHRLWSHRAYTATKTYRFLLMLFNCIAFQGELLYWCRDHRVHHKASDTTADPHNIKRGFWFAHIGWLYLPRSKENVEAMKIVPLNDLYSDPVVMFQLKYYIYLVILLRFIVPSAIAYSFTGSWKAGFLIANTMWCQTLHHTFLVNSAAHLKAFGYRPYDKNIFPNENRTVIVAALGEGHHNFHHSFPEDYATSELDWTETFNPTKAFIDLGAKLGMVTSRTRYVRNKSTKKWISVKLSGNKKTI